MKYCSEVCVFFFTVSELSPSLPHSWPTPRWDGRRGGSVHSGCPLPIFLSVPPPPYSVWSKAQNYSKGRGQVRRRVFHIERGAGAETQLFTLFWRSDTVWVLLFALAHLLPLCDPGSENTLSSWFWPAKGIFQEQAAARVGGDAKMTFKHWGNSYSSFRYQLKLCFSSYNRLNL